MIGNKQDKNVESNMLNLEYEKDLKQQMRRNNLTDEDRQL
jgi:hypothetical protein